MTTLVQLFTLRLTLFECKFVAEAPKLPFIAETDISVSTALNPTDQLPGQGCSLNHILLFDLFKKIRFQKKNVILIKNQYTLKQLVRRYLNYQLYLYHQFTNNTIQLCFEAFRKQKLNHRKATRICLRKPQGINTLYYWLFKNFISNKI